MFRYSVCTMLATAMLSGCGDIASVTNLSGLSVKFIQQNFCGVESVPSNVSAYVLNDDNSVGAAFKINSSGIATADVTGDTASFMVIRDRGNGLDVYVAKDIDVGNLGTWYFDTDDKTSCLSSCRNDLGTVKVEVSPGNSETNHINWPATLSGANVDKATYSVDGHDICTYISSAYTDPLFVAFANDTNSTLKYYIGDDLTSLLSGNTIGVDINGNAVTSRSLNIPQTETNTGSLYYASDDMYEFHADYEARLGARLLSNHNRVTPLRFSTNKQLTNASSAATVKWIVDLPLSSSTSTINYDVPGANSDTGITDALTDLATGITTAYDFSNDDQDAVLEYVKISDNGLTDHWTIVQSTSGKRFTDFKLPQVYANARSMNYGDSNADHSVSIIDFAGYRGYLYSNQGLALRELFTQSDSDRMKQLHPLAWELNFEVHEVVASEN